MSLPIALGVFDPANPGTIGGTTPAAGTFTILTANTRVVAPDLRDGGNNAILLLSSGTLTVKNSGSFNWSSTATVGTADTGVTRNAAGVVEVNNGVAGTFRDLKLRTLICGATQATNMTDGFIQVPGAAGLATGTPTDTTGVPLYYDKTNNKLMAYNGAWRSSGAFA